MEWWFRATLLLLVAASGGAAQEYVSPLGKSFAALPDPKGTVESADLALARGPASADLLLAAAAARDALYRFSESIPIYTRGIDEYPNDVRFLRFRGHRFLNLRRFDPAILDLKKASEIAPSSFDLSYHLALAYYLRGDYNHAAREFQRCLALGAVPAPAVPRGMPAGWRSCHNLDADARVATLHWNWLALRRTGKAAEAAALLAQVDDKVTVKENTAYLRNILQFKREHAEELPGPQYGPTVGYSHGMWHLLAGRREQACAAFQKVLSSPHWTTFGYIGAEAEVARGACRPARKR
jgi:tetratricopeptide (TPR) repeat protein